MNALSAPDLKRIKLMEKKIHLFEDKNIDLYSTVCDLGGLLNYLESVENPWKCDFESNISELELISDSIQDGSILKWKGNPQEDIHELISKLKKLTTLLLEKYLSSPDSNILESAVLLDTHWLMCPKCIDAWESTSTSAMVICSICDQAFHNPSYQNN